MSKSIAILLGTSNKSGNTAALVKQIQDTACHQSIKVFDLQDYEISAFDYQHRNIDDDFINLVEQLLSYDTLIFASPVYWYTMSGQMKIFFDRFSDLLHIKKDMGRQLRGKSAAVLSTGASPAPERSFEEVFTNSFNYLGMNYLGMIYCYCEQEFDHLEHQQYIRFSWQKMWHK